MGGGLSDGGRALTRCGEAAEAPVSGSAPPGVDHSSTCVRVCACVCRYQLKHAPALCTHTLLSDCTASESSSFLCAGSPHAQTKSKDISSSHGILTV